MASHPQTPQDYCNYFQGLQPPEPKWEIGLRAAQLWRDSRGQGDGPNRNQILIVIVKTLMPVRHCGIVLLDLWQWVLRDVAKLPVAEQKEVWLEVFNVANQGEQQIQHSEVAVQIVQEWAELEKDAELTPISMKIMMNVVDKIYRYSFTDYDWIAFTLAMGEWFKKYIDEPSFYDSVIDRMKMKSNG